MQTLVIIPARGGSKGVNRKNMQLLDGVPLVIRAAQEAWQLRGARVVVSTEDPEIMAACYLRGIDAVSRPPELAGDSVPLAPVIAHAVQAFACDTVLVLQPTTLLSSDDLQGCLDQFQVARAQGIECLFGTVPEPHVMWQDGRRTTPHLQRQELAVHPQCPAREVGLRIMTPEYAASGAGVVGTLELDQAPDVDTYDDLADLERRASRRWVELAFLADPRWGTGHVFRCLRLADRLRRDHDVTVRPLDVRGGWVDDLLKRHDLSVAPDTSRVPDLLILDALDQYDSQIVAKLQYGVPTVVFESQSQAAIRYAAATFDELHDTLIPAGSHHYLGPKYAVLREEFIAFPQRTYNGGYTKPKVLISFGGSDPSHLARRIAGLLPDGLDVRVVQGPAAADEDFPGHITVVKDAVMSQEMWEADLAITSKGRTQFETAACGTPTLTLAANEREAHHLNLRGHLHLGLHAAVSDQTIYEAVFRTLGSVQTREEMGTAARAQVDGKGVERICHVLDGILRGL